MKRMVLGWFCIVLGLMAMGCGDLLTSSDKSSDKAITAFIFTAPAAAGVITEASLTIAVTVPYGTNVTALVPTIIHTGASISPASGAARDFSSPVTYTVTAADSSKQEYLVTVTVASASSKAITAFAFSTPAAMGVITEASHTVAVTVPYGTNVTALVPTIIHTGASISPASGTAQNFTSPVTYTVTASDASTQEYVVAVTIDPADYISVNIGALKYVPAGSFQRDATTTNISTITTAYRMSAHEITREQFLAIIVTDPSDVGYSSGTTDPVQMTNWYHAIAFCNKLSIAEGLTPVYAVTGVNFTTLTYASIPTTSDATWNAATATWTNNGYRLPTEMEWMWAAMGAASDGTATWVGGVNTTGYTKGYAGSTEAGGAQVDIGNYAWYDVNSDSKTHPAGTKTANELGLYDMSGNVWEWCWDWGDTYPTGIQTDYRGAASGMNRVGRGGGWTTDKFHCLVAGVAGRLNGDPSGQYGDFGFRVVRP